MKAEIKEGIIASKKKKKLKKRTRPKRVQAELVEMKVGGIGQMPEIVEPVEILEGKSRPIKPYYWKPEMSEWVYKLAMIGATHMEIADFLKVSLTTIKDWIRKDFPPFTDALRLGGEQLNMDLVSALIKRAKGYRYNETIVHKVNGKVVREEITTKTMAPDAYALLKIMALRKPEQWRERSVTDVNINYQGDLDVRVISEQIKDRQQFSDEELKVALKMGLIEISERATN